MYKVAVVGYRAQGSIHHAPSFARLPDCEIVAICDVVEERAQEGAERYSVPAYTDVDEMLEQEDIDIVNIPTGEQFRYDLVMKALRLGNHVFTEKPLAGAEGQYRIGLSDVGPVREMVDEWQKHDVHFGVCFGLHYSPNIIKLKELIKEGTLGNLKQIQARTAIGSWNHLIDMVRFLGGEVDEVFAYADDKEEMGNKAACLRFEDGAVGTLAVSRNLGLQFQIKWIGDEGDAWADNIAGAASMRPKGSNEVTAWDDRLGLRGGTYPGLFEGLIEEFVACIKEKRPFVADGWAGLRHMEVDGAITESIRTGIPVRVARYLPEKGRTLLGQG